MKGQVLDDVFKFMESVKIENDCSGSLGKRVYQVPVNCHIQIGYKMKEKSTKDLTYVQVVSLNLCSMYHRYKEVDSASYR